MTLCAIYHTPRPAIGALETNYAECALAHGPDAGLRGNLLVIHEGKEQ